MRVRVLSQASVEAMTRDQPTPEQRQGAEIFFGTHSSWGCGMAVNVRATGDPWVVPGRFGWDGGYGTTAYSDPKNDLVGILPDAAAGGRAGGAEAVYRGVSKGGKGWKLEGGPTDGPE